MNELLISALRAREAEYRTAIDQLAGDESGDQHAEYLLREAIELVACLRRILPGVDLQELHRAFGAPGDFGYQTPIGHALYRIYLGGSLP